MCQKRSGLDGLSSYVHIRLSGMYKFKMLCNGKSKAKLKPLKNRGFITKL